MRNYRLLSRAQCWRAVYTFFTPVKALFMRFHFVPRIQQLGESIQHLGPSYSNNWTFLFTAVLAHVIPSSPMHLWGYFRRA
jgi:hypothetical protein